MSSKEHSASNYRWIILALYFFITLIIEVQWLTFASISTAAQEYYHVGAPQIDFLSVIYMIVFIILSIPASYFIDTYGLRKGLAIGALLTGGFGMMKWLFAENYVLVAIAQTGLAAAQPFILNSVTKVGADWFPKNERATVAGIGSLAQYLGIIIALAITPLLVSSSITGQTNMEDMLKIYGIASLIFSFLLLILFRESPQSSASESSGLNPIEGMKCIFSSYDMKLLLIMFFLGLGIFNAVSTCIDQICGSLTMEETGTIGGAMLLGGILGAIILPILSDRLQKRKPFLIFCMAFMIPGLLGLTFFESFYPLLISSFAFGFFIMSAGPIGFQYGAEKSYPAPESTSQGLILLAGQISGILFVFGVNLMGIFISMLIFNLLIVVNVFLTLRISESYAATQ